MASQSAFPSYEAVRTPEKAVLVTDDMKRLYWTLDGPLETAISVMPQPYYEADATREPYFTPAMSAWHAVSQAAFTEPRVSSCTVSVRELDEWEDIFLDFHEEHNEDDPTADRGPLPDPTPEELAEPWPPGHRHLLSCCGFPRPRNKAVSLVVRAGPEGPGFVTVHDYVTQIHPWLLGLRADLLGAVGVVHGDDGEPLPADAKLKLMVFPQPDCLWACPESEWMMVMEKREALAPRQPDVRNFWADPFPEDPTQPLVLGGHVFWRPGFDPRTESRE